MTLPLPARPDATVVRRRLDPWRAVGFVCSLAALAPNPASAVGLGPITQQSALGQSLRVVVPVTLGPDEDLPSECFKITAAERDVDGIPQLLFGRVNLERSPSGTALVITNARTVSDPIVRLTIQAGCEAAIRREYTLFMDPPAIEAPIVAAETAPREVAVAPPPAPAARESRRPAPPRARTSTRTAPAPGSADDAEAKGKPAPQKDRAVAKAAPKRPPPVAAERPRLSLSSGAPGHRRRRISHRSRPRTSAAGASRRDRSRDAGAATAHRGAHGAGRAHATGIAGAGTRGTGGGCSCRRRLRRRRSRQGCAPASACGRRAGRTGEGRIGEGRLRQRSQGEQRGARSCHRLVGRQCGADRCHRPAAIADRCRAPLEAPPGCCGRRPMANRPDGGAPHGTRTAFTRVRVAQSCGRPRDGLAGAHGNRHRNAIQPDRATRRLDRCACRLGTLACHRGGARIRGARSSRTRDRGVAGPHPAATSFDAGGMAHAAGPASRGGTIARNSAGWRRIFTCISTCRRRCGKDSPWTKREPPVSKAFPMSSSR